MYHHHHPTTNIFVSVELPLYPLSNSLKYIENVTDNRAVYVLKLWTRVCTYSRVMDK